MANKKTGKTTVKASRPPYSLQIVRITPYGLESENFTFAKTQTEARAKGVALVIRTPGIGVRIYDERGYLPKLLGEIAFDSGTLAWFGEDGVIRGLTRDGRLTSERRY